MMAQNHSFPMCVRNIYIIFIRRRGCESRSKTEFCEPPRLKNSHDELVPQAHRLLRERTGFLRAHLWCLSFKYNDNH